MRNTYFFISTLLFIFLSNFSYAQTIQDDFEGNGNINSWYGDDCAMDPFFNNPHQIGINTSSTVLRYYDSGGQYANIRFDAGKNFNLSAYPTFSLKIYVPSSGLTGNQNNQVSLKLQDGNLGAPWSTQSEIIKPVILDQWQTVTFDFANDPYTNLNGASPAPTQRTDFNRVVIQVNGENNNDQVLAYLDDFYYFDSTVVVAPPVFDQLVWSDEFSSNGAVDNSKWFHQTQLPNGGSWYNGEVQHYTNRTANAVVNNGILSIVAKKETYTNQGHTKQYTSARLNSKFTFKYGRVEVRAKLPAGVGTWPAIWTLGKNISEPGAYWQTQGYGTTAWPACGEIDIMEHWGTNQNFVQSATHTPSSHGGTINHGGQTILTVSNAFHVYALEWTADKLVFSVDSVVHYTYQPTTKNASTWPFDADQYLLLNVAIQPTISPGFTQASMDIDYVRVYQESTVSVNEISVNKKLRYFPNPVNDELTLQLPSSAKQAIDFNLYHVNGQLIRTFKKTPEQNLVKLNGLESLPKGIYMLSCIINGEKYNLKVLK